MDSKAQQFSLPDSSRLSGLAPHTIWLFRLDAKIAELRAAGADIINLGVGNPDQPTHPDVVAAGQLALADPANHRYPDQTGTPQFRQAVAHYYARNFGVSDLDPESQVVPTLGSQEALFNLTMAFTSPGDVVLSGDPGYPIHVSGPVLAGATPEYIPLDPSRGFAPDYASVPAAVAEAAKLMYLCYPNNPTGAVGTPEIFEEAIAFAHEHGVFIVHDFAYGDLGLDGFRPRSFLATPGAIEVGVELYSLTKGHNMAGWRVGSVVGRADAIERYLAVKAEVDCGTFHAVQAAAVAALAPSADAATRELSDMYTRRREVVAGALEQAGIPVQRQRATPYVWSPVPNGYESCEAFAQFVLETANVAISPGWAFGPSGTGYFRISLMADDAVLAEAASRLAALPS